MSNRSTKNPSNPLSNRRTYGKKTLIRRPDLPLTLSHGNTKASIQDICIQVVNSNLPLNIQSLYLKTVTTLEHDQTVKLHKDTITTDNQLISSVMGFKIVKKKQNKDEKNLALVISHERGELSEIELLSSQKKNDQEKGKNNKKRLIGPHGSSVVEGNDNSSSINRGSNHKNHINSRLSLGSDRNEKNDRNAGVFGVFGPDLSLFDPFSVLNSQDVLQSHSTTSSASFLSDLQNNIQLQQEYYQNNEQFFNNKNNNKNNIQNYGDGIYGDGVNVSDGVYGNNDLINSDGYGYRTTGSVNHDRAAVSYDPFGFNGFDQMSTTEPCTSDSDINGPSSTVHGRNTHLSSSTTGLFQQRDSFRQENFQKFSNFDQNFQNNLSNNSNNNNYSADYWLNNPHLGSDLSMMGVQNGRNNGQNGQNNGQNGQNGQNSGQNSGQNDGLDSDYDQYGSGFDQTGQYDSGFDPFGQTGQYPTGFDQTGQYPSGFGQFNTGTTGMMLNDVDQIFFGSNNDNDILFHSTFDNFVQNFQKNGSNFQKNGQNYDQNGQNYDQNDEFGNFDDNSMLDFQYDGGNPFKNGQNGQNGQKSTNFHENGQFITGFGHSIDSIGGNDIIDQNQYNIQQQLIALQNGMATYYSLNGQNNKNNFQNNNEKILIGKNGEIIFSGEGEKNQKNFFDENFFLEENKKKNGNLISENARLDGHFDGSDDENLISGADNDDASRRMLEQAISKGQMSQKMIKMSEKETIETKNSLKNAKNVQNRPIRLTRSQQILYKLSEYGIYDKNTLLPPQYQQKHYQNQKKIEKNFNFINEKKNFEKNNENEKKKFFYNFFKKNIFSKLFFPFLSPLLQQIKLYTNEYDIINGEYNIHPSYMPFSQCEEIRYEQICQDNGFEILNFEKNSPSFSSSSSEKNFNEKNKNLLKKISVKPNFFSHNDPNIAQSSTNSTTQFISLGYTIRTNHSHHSYNDYGQNGQNSKNSHFSASSSHSNVFNLDFHHPDPFNTTQFTILLLNLIKTDVNWSENQRNNIENVKKMLKLEKQRAQRDKLRLRRQEWSESDGNSDFDSDGEQDNISNYRRVTKKDQDRENFEKNSKNFEKNAEKSSVSKERLVKKPKQQQQLHTTSTDLTRSNSSNKSHLSSSSNNSSNNNIIKKRRNNKMGDDEDDDDGDDDNFHHRLDIHAQCNDDNDNEDDDIDGILIKGNKKQRYNSQLPLDNAYNSRLSIDNANNSDQYLYSPHSHDDAQFSSDSTYPSHFHPSHSHPFYPPHFNPSDSSYPSHFLPFSSYSSHFPPSSSSHSSYSSHYSSSSSNFSPNLSISEHLRLLIRTKYLHIPVYSFYNTLSPYITPHFHVTNLTIWTMMTFPTLILTTPDPFSSYSQDNALPLPYDEGLGEINWGNCQDCQNNNQKFYNFEKNFNNFKNFQKISNEKFFSQKTKYYSWNLWSRVVSEWINIELLDHILHIEDSWYKLLDILFNSTLKLTLSSNVCSDDDQKIQNKKDEKKNFKNNNFEYNFKKNSQFLLQNFSSQSLNIQDPPFNSDDSSFLGCSGQNGQNGQNIDQNGQLSQHLSGSFNDFISSLGPQSSLITHSSDLCHQIDSNTTHPSHRSHLSDPIDPSHTSHSTLMMESSSTDITTTTTTSTTMTGESINTNLGMSNLGQNDEDFNEFNQQNDENFQQNDHFDDFNRENDDFNQKNCENDDFNKKMGDFRHINASTIDENGQNIDRNDENGQNDQNNDKNDKNDENIEKLTFLGFNSTTNRFKQRKFNKCLTMFRSLDETSYNQEIGLVLINLFEEQQRDWIKKQMKIQKKEQKENNYYEKKNINNFDQNNMKKYNYNFGENVNNGHMFDENSVENVDNGHRLNENNVENYKNTMNPYNQNNTDNGFNQNNIENGHSFNQKNFDHGHNLNENFNNFKNTLDQNNIDNGHSFDENVDNYNTMSSFNVSGLSSLSNTQCDPLKPQEQGYFQQNHQHQQQRGYFQQNHQEQQQFQQDQQYFQQQGQFLRQQKQQQGQFFQQQQLQSNPSIDIYSMNQGLDRYNGVYDEHWREKYRNGNEGDENLTENGGNLIENNENKENFDENLIENNENLNFLNQSHNNTQQSQYTQQSLKSLQGCYINTLYDAQNEKNSKNFDNNNDGQEKNKNFNSQEKNKNFNKNGQEKNNNFTNSKVPMVVGSGESYEHFQPDLSETDMTSTGTTSTTTSSPFLPDKTSKNNNKNTNTSQPEFNANSPFPLQPIQFTTVLDTIALNLKYSSSSQSLSKTKGSNIINNGKNSKNKNNKNSLPSSFSSSSSSSSSISSNHLPPHLTLSRPHVSQLFVALLTLNRNQIIVLEQRKVPDQQQSDREKKEKNQNKKNKFQNKKNNLSKNISMEERGENEVSDENTEGNGKIIDQLDGNESSNKKKNARKRLKAQKDQNETNELKEKNQLNMNGYGYGPISITPGVVWDYYCYFLLNYNTNDDQNNEIKIRK